MKTTHGNDLHTQKCSEQKTTSRTVFMAFWLRKVEEKKWNWSLENELD